MFRREVLSNRIEMVIKAFENIRDEYVPQFDAGKLNKEEYDLIVLPRYRKRVELIETIKEQIKNLTPEVGEGATQYFYTDTEPWEVVRVISDKTIEVRKMDAVLNPDWKAETIIGGFSGHTINNKSQEWTITSNDENPKIKVRKHKNGQWVGIAKTKFYFGYASKFYDYNF